MATLVPIDDEQPAAKTLVPVEDAPAPDKYQQAAIDERNRLIAKGIPRPEGYTRRLMAGPFLSWGDEIGAAMVTPLEMIRQGTLDPREGYRYAKAREDLAAKAARENTGVLGDVAELTGGLAVGPGQVFAPKLAAAVGGGAKGTLPALARMGAYGVDAGVLGAVQGAGAAQNVSDIPEAAMRSGLLSAAIGAPFGAVADVARRTAAKVPTEAELTAKGVADYAARKALPVSYDLKPVQGRLGEIAQDTASEYGLKSRPTLAVINREAGDMQAAIDAANRANAVNLRNPVVAAGQPSGLANTTTATVRPDVLSDLRDVIFQEGAKGGGKTGRKAATTAAEEFDRILTSPEARYLAPGVNMRDAIAAAELTQRGRGNFAASFRSKSVGDAVKRALDDAGAVHSGLNFENRLRANIKSADRKAEFRGFSADEKPVVEEFIRGTARDNLIRELGNRLAGGGGWGSTMLMGAGGMGGAATAYATGQDPVAGAALGLGLASAGRGVRAYGNKRIQNKAEAFQEKLRMRSPEYAARVAAAPTEIGPGLAPTMSGLRQALTIGNEGEIRDALVRALIYQTTGRRE